ncbi:MAG: hypothetical protein LBQ09_04570 [Acidobacteriaceae bacterium]|jgi:uncharacterized membrane protein|nr:hypothetical protein [Acidobacteriaceae bacterium]
MGLAAPFPWWVTLLALAAIAAVVFTAYRRPLAPLAPWQRIVLSTLRGAAFVWMLLLLQRPVLLQPPDVTGDLIIPILVDTSKSMRIADAEGDTRIARARAIVEQQLLPALGPHVRTEVMAVADGVHPQAVETLDANGRSTDLRRALTAVKERARGQRVPAVVLVSDGGETSTSVERATSTEVPVFTVGVGDVAGPRDREITGLTAGDPRIDRSSVDLHVTAVARGFGRDPFTIEILANGQQVDAREVRPASEGSPVDATFTVSPNPLQPTVYTARIKADVNDHIQENDARSLLVSPAGRKRRVLLLAGAPGYEHGFFQRAMQQDSGIEIDAVTRKGKNDQGADTFFVQASGGRATALTTGFPSTREALFAYDTVVIANLEGEFFTRAQMDLLSAFVSERGGGLLLFGGRSFGPRSLLGSPLEEALPLELSDRRGGTLRASGEDLSGSHDSVTLTRDGERHAMMRFAPTVEDNRKQWSTLPALTANAPVGGPRPGATVLAVTSGSNGVVPVVAVQPYGRGRSMIFAGEGTWRWRMLLPSDDRRYDTFWRQAVRWLAADAPDPVSITVAADTAVGQSMTLAVDVRDRQYVAVADAAVDGRVIGPGGETTPLTLRPAGPGHFAGTFVPEIAGVYRIAVSATRGAASLGTAEQWAFAGGSDPEFADPRMNEALLRRLSRESGGRYVTARDVADIIPSLMSAAPQPLDLVRKDIWNHGWTFAVAVALLGAEWVLRRRWGLR